MKFSQLQSNITSLGPRYTPELNVETDNLLAFEAITFSDAFTDKVNQHLKEIVNSVQRKKESTLHSENGKGYYRKFTEEITDKVMKIDLFLANVEKIEQRLTEFKELEDELKNIYKAADPDGLFGQELEEDERSILYDYLSKIRRNIYSYNHYLDSSCHETLYNPYLLLYGEAGIGKSHLLADMAEKNREQGHIVFLFLGQHFSSSSDPWKQIMSGLNLDVSLEMFFSTVNREAEKSGKRAFLIIDALNEGEGRSLWKNYIQRFIVQIKGYPNIGLIFSIRTPFMKLILPDEFIETNNISMFEHVGFIADGYSPIKAFCAHYGLEEPVFPLLNPEYNNPLFLKLVCQLHVSKSQSSFDQDIKITRLFSYIIEDANMKLAHQERLDYDSNLHVIQEVLHEVVALQHQSTYGEMDYLDVYKAVTKVSGLYTNRKTKVLEAIIQENILFDTVNYLGERIVYFAYERMGDYLLADYLLEEYKNKAIIKEDIINNIKQNEGIQKYFSTESNMSFNIGLMQALSVTLPEQFATEFFEVFSEDKEKRYVIVNTALRIVLECGSFVHRMREKSPLSAKCFVHHYNLLYTCFMYEIFIQISCRRLFL